MQELVDIHFPKAQRIRVVLDNLSTHTAGALYQAFPPTEVRRLLNRLEFHYVPKHASWLNMVEIEIGVLSSQCLDRRIDSKQRLVSEIAAWERQRNASRARTERSARADEALNDGHVACWPIASFSCIAEFCRYRCIADFCKPSGRADLWVHGLVFRFLSFRCL
jgi:hypothetical protein